MTIAHTAMPEFVQTLGPVRVIVDAWTTKQAHPDDVLAYDLAGEIHVNPAIVLQDPQTAAMRIAALRRQWSAILIADAVLDARARIRAAFAVEDDGDGVLVVLDGKRLRVGGATWQGKAREIAATKQIDLALVREFILDQARTNLANAVATVDWT